MKKLNWKNIATNFCKGIAFLLILFGFFAVCVFILEAKVRGWL